MTPELHTAATLVHFSALGALSLYGLHRIWLLINWWLQRRSTAQPVPALPENLPWVTVQLPIFNERFVAERLLDAVARLDWPADRLEIQVLDDSSDDTSAIVAKRLAHWQKQGICIRHIHRSLRDGFKAGALAAGLKEACGEFVAIFDADFIPAPDFLTQTIPHFHDPRVGMVQTRWGFCNAEHSWLTGVQALLLGPHFSIEHQVRFHKGLFFNFNGTAGIWRREAIADAEIRHHRQEHPAAAGFSLSPERTTVPAVQLSPLAVQPAAPVIRLAARDMVCLAALCPLPRRISCGHHPGTMGRFPKSGNSSLPATCLAVRAIRNMNSREITWRILGFQGSNSLSGIHQDSGCLTIVFHFSGAARRISLKYISNPFGSPFGTELFSPH
ncbi:MAG: glycosyltransferase [Geobacter sp.]|nr:MAG: glycosyltransferase [Geobacter sp.]